MRLPPLAATWIALALASAAGAVDFEADIRPLLRERCSECHGEKKQKGELRLDLRAQAQKGGDTGPAWIPGNADASF